VPVLYALAFSNDDSTEYSSLESKSEGAVAAPASGYVCMPGSVWCVSACESRAGLVLQGTGTGTHCSSSIVEFVISMRNKRR
jgi:hypothetical protein